MSPLLKGEMRCFLINSQRRILRICWCKGEGISKIGKPSAYLTQAAKTRYNKGKLEMRFSNFCTGASNPHDYRNESTCDIVLELARKEKTAKNGKNPRRFSKTHFQPSPGAGFRGHCCNWAIPLAVLKPNTFNL